MSTFKQLAENKDNNKHFTEIFKIIADKMKDGDLDIVKDGSGGKFSISDINQIQELEFNVVKDSFEEQEIQTQTMDDFKKSAVLDLSGRMKSLKASLRGDIKQMVTDGFYNPMSGVGTYNDPGMYNSAYVPLIMSPQEASSYYSSGGIPKVIIDKKAKIPLLNGYQFVGDLDPDDLAMLKDYSQKVGFDRAILSGNRDAFTFGGACLVPIFKKDEPDTYQLKIDELLSKKILDKDCIDYFFTADRWNMITVPDYNITAKDYLQPKFFFVPLGSMKVNTKRAALINPSPLPYWAAIRQLGWSCSDFEGWMRQLMAYNIIIASIPIMAQQLSLLLHEIPLEGIIAENGPDYAQQFIKKNEEQLRRWSMYNPMALNTFGKLSVIDRNFSGIQELVQISRQDVSANCSIAESVIFHTQPTGFSDNQEDLTLKQSETIKLYETELKYNLRNVIEILAISCFGADSEQAKKAGTVNIDFSAPVVLSDDKKGDAGVKFTQCVSQLVTSGMPLDMAINNTKQFFPMYEISEDDIDRLKDFSETNQPPEGGLNNSDKKGIWQGIKEKLG